MTEKEKRQIFGREMRRFRERVLGITRDAFGRRLGVSGNTVKQVELGYQNLGAGARRTYEELRRKSQATVEGAAPVADAAERVSLEQAARWMADGEFEGQVAQVIAALRCTRQTAVEAVLRARLRESGGGDGG